MNSSRSLRQALKGKILTFNKNPVRVLNNFKCQYLLSSSLSLFDNSEFMKNHDPQANNCFVAKLLCMGPKLS